jgi:PAS domain S-box-containing protein
MRHFYNSIRWRMIFIVTLGLIPCVGLTLFTAIEQRRSILNKAHESAFRSAGNFLKVFSFAIDETRNMLVDLAREPQTQEMSPALCSRYISSSFFKNVLTMYNNLGLIDSKGKLVCSVVPIPDSDELSSRPCFQEAMKTGEFSIGTAETGPSSPRGAITIVYPVIGSAGEIRGAVFASIDLRWFNNIAANAGIPDHSILTAIDSTGTILARSANPEKWVGHSAPDAEIVQKIFKEKQGTTEAVGVDGTKKIYGFSRAGGFSKGVYVYVGIPKDTVVGAANQLVFFDVVWLGIALLAAFSGVWILTRILIMRQVDTLVKTTNKIASGNLRVRTGLDDGAGELGILGSAFDKMAKALEEREIERKKSHEDLQKEKQFSEQVINSLPGVFYLFDSRGKVLRWNQNAELVTGYSSEEISRMRSLDFVLENDKNSLKNGFVQVFDKGETAMEAHYLTKQGTSIPYYFTGRKIEIGNTQCVLGVGIDISERQKAEKALEDSEKLLKTILATSPVGIHLAENRIIKWANESWARMFGFEHELDYVGQSARILYQSEDEFERVGQVLYKHLGPGKVTEIDAKLRRRDGSDFDGVIRITHLNPSEPGNDTIVAVVTDISQRIQNEQALRESEERYRNLIDTMTEGLGLIDDKGIIEYVNKRSAEMLGYREDELVGHRVDEFLEKSSLNIFLDQMTQRTRTPSRSYELEWRRKDGTIIHTLVTSTSIWNADGSLKGSLATATDITDRKKYEQRLEDSEKKMRLLIEQAPIGVGIFQKEKYVYANPELMAIFSCESQDEIVGKALSEFVAPGHQRLFKERYKRFMLGKPMRTSYQLEGFKKTGVLFDMVLWPKKIDYEGEPAILAFIMDVTETKNLRAQLLQAQKMEAIGTLAGGVAHDFNNLLQVVIGYSELIMMDPQISDKLRKNVKSINKVATNGADLVKSLLTFSRKTETKPKPINLNREIVQIKKLLDRTIPKMIEIELDLQEELSLINADSSQIEQVVMNLAVNARDAMPEGGRLILETENVILDAAYCAVHLDAAPGPHVLLSVSDTGQGMDKKTMERIFEPFFTTKALGKGTGLGLAMVYGLVKQHQGSIICYSEPEVGTTFKIYFPSLVPQNDSDESKISQSSIGGTETILLVDDEENVRDVGKDLLEGSGYTVITASSGREALELYKDKRSSISLIILDLIMPEMGGKECLEGLLKIDSSVKTLICSGYSANGTAKEAVATGAKGFISKPYNLNEMLAQIRRIIDPKESS